MDYFLKQYGLQQGALEIQYIEEFFLDFPRKKTANEVIARLDNRDHQILMAEARLPDDRGTVVPVSFKVAHELRATRAIPSWRTWWRSSRTSSSSTAGGAVSVDRRHA